MARLCETCGGEIDEQFGCCMACMTDDVRRERYPGWARLHDEHAKLRVAVNELLRCIEAYRDFAYDKGVECACGEAKVCALCAVDGAIARVALRMEE